MRVMRKGFTLILECLISIEVLICIGVFPTLFANLSFHLKDYFHAVIDFSVRLFTFQTFTYSNGMLKYPLFPAIFGKYLDSMEILGLGLILAFVIAFVFAYVSLIFFRKRMGVIKKFMEMAESIPDLLFIFLMQMLIIAIYKKTGVLLLQVESLREKAIMLPVISVAVPISFYITKVIIFHIEEELNKEYVVLVKSKGFSFPYILNIHVLRNIVEGLFINSKTIIWSMLSALLLIDKIFNMNALLGMMARGTDPFIIGCLLIFIPFFILYRIFQWVSFDRRKDTY